MLTASARVYPTARTPSGGASNRHELPELGAAGSRPGYGEVLGIPDALWVWFGTEFRDANQILKSAPRNAAELARKAEVYRQVVALLVADRARAPSAQ